MNLNLELKDKGFYTDISWSDSTDGEISCLLSLANIGYVDLEKDCSWKVGDERQIVLTTGEHVTFVLMHKGEYYDVYNNEVNFVVGMKNCLRAAREMNDDEDIPNVLWGSSDMRTWLNGKFYFQIPISIRSIFKQFKCITSADFDGPTLQTTHDYFSLPAAKEIFGGKAKSVIGGESTSWSNRTEFDALFQFDWYKDKSNRIKMLAGNKSTQDIGYSWWERSPNCNTSDCFCTVDEIGHGYSNFSIGTFGVSPFGCI